MKLITIATIATMFTTNVLAQQITKSPLSESYKKKVPLTKFLGSEEEGTKWRSNCVLNMRAEFEFSRSSDNKSELNLNISLLAYESFDGCKGEPALKLFSGNKVKFIDGYEVTHKYDSGYEHKYLVGHRIEIEKGVVSLESSESITALIMGSTSAQFGGCLNVEPKSTTRASCNIKGFNVNNVFSEERIKFQTPFSFMFKLDDKVPGIHFKRVE